MPDNINDKTAHTSGDADESSTGITGDEPAEDDADEGADDDSTGGGNGDADSTGGGSGAFFAACDVGSHPPFIGPTRSTRQAAQDDADTHNLSCDAAGAV